MPRAAPPAALRALLRREEIELDVAEPGTGPGCWQVRGRRWVALSLPGRPAPLHVALPVAGEVRRGARGRYEAHFAPPTADEMAEAENFARSVLSHGQASARASASHTIETDARGREKLVRRGFSAR